VFTYTSEHGQMTLMPRPETPANRCANKVQSHAHMWKTQSTLNNKEKE